MNTAFFILIQRQLSIGLILISEFLSYIFDLNEGYSEVREENAGELVPLIQRGVTAYSPVR